jgi:hypothetical protein
MKTKTQRALDAALDKRQKRITDILVKDSILSYKEGDLAAYKKLNIESSFKQVHKAALVYVKEYGELLTKEGASMIQDATPPYSYTKIPWLKDNSTRARKQVVDVLEAGLKEGKPVASIGGKHVVEGTIAHDLQELIVRGKEYENVRIARTEIARIQMEASKRRYIVNGIDEIDRLCGPDPCDACAELCGKRFKTNVAPGLLHPDCTCVNNPVIPKGGLK